MVRVLCILVASSLLAACAAMNPQPNPQLLAKIDGYFAVDSAKTYPSSGQFTRPMPYEVGQFVVHGVIEGAERSVMKMSLVGEESGGWIIENYSLSPTDENITQILVTGLEEVARTGDLEALDILWVKVRNNNQQVQTFDGALLTMTGGLYKKSLSGLAVSSPEMGPGGTVETPAGVFQNTVSSSTEVSFLGMSYPSTSWLHTAVPINGMVKSISGDGDQETQLLDFGLTGATRSF